MDPESRTPQSICQEFELLNELRMENLLCDTVLRLEDGGIFPVHSPILSVRSEYFKTLFTTPLHCTKRTDVLLPGVTSETMSLILEYVYMRSVDINQENVRTLLMSADNLRMPGLLELCRNFLKSMLTPENCIGIMRFARVYSSGLEGDARCFVMRNFVQVLQQNDELLELTPEELKAIIGADELNVKSEEIVWDGVLRWINHDEENRKGNIAELIMEVRLGLLDRKFVLENVKEHPYVAGNNECSAVIMHVVNSLPGIPYRNFARPRIQHETLFVIGRLLLHSRTNHVQMYYTPAKRWFKVAEMERVYKRYLFGTAVVGFNIYMIGGHDSHDPLDSCHCFNVVSRTWCEVSPMHARRASLSVAVLDGLVYAIGGCHNNSTAERYDYRTNRWSMIAPLNENRITASATTLNGKIYVVGGFNGYGYVNSAEVYDPKIDQWTCIERMMSVRGNLCCIAYHGYVYAIGGTNGESCMCSVEKYNPTTNAWMQVPDMSQPRKEFGIAVIDDTIFALGGIQGYTLRNSVECYDEKSNKWTAARDMNTYVLDMSACVIMDLPNVCDYVGLPNAFDYIKY